MQYGPADSAVTVVNGHWAAAAATSIAAERTARGRDIGDLGWAREPGRWSAPRESTGAAFLWTSGHIGMLPDVRRASGGAPPLPRRIVIAGSIPICI